MTPYIGITGVTTPQEAAYTSEALSILPSTHQGMIGILASFKTLMGNHVMNRRYPPVNKIAEILECIPRDIFTTLHYNSREPHLYKQLNALLGYVNRPVRIQGVQLNIAWPDVQEVRAIKEGLNQKIIFQASRRVLSTPHMIERFAPYAEHVDYVLLDPSSGRGEAFDLEESCRLYEQFNDCYPQIGIGFAGGLSAENVESRVQELIARLGTSEFCIDAEGNLRDKRSVAYGDDDLSEDKVRAFSYNAGCALAPSAL